MSLQSIVAVLLRRRRPEHRHVWVRVGGIPGEWERCETCGEWRAV